MKKFAMAAIAAAALFALASCGKKESDSITIGGIFPLSGNVSVYGVECKNGIDLARLTCSVHRAAHCEAATA